MQNLTLEEYLKSKGVNNLTDQETVRTLKNGIVIPTALSMERRIAKFA